VHGHAAAHLLDNLLANTQAEAGAAVIRIDVLLEAREVNEQFLEALLTDSLSIVYNFNDELVVHQVALVSVTGVVTSGTSVATHH